MGNAMSILSLSHIVTAMGKPFRRISYHGGGSRGEPQFRGQSREPHKTQHHNRRDRHRSSGAVVGTNGRRHGWATASASNPVFCGERGGNVQTTHCRGFRTCHGGAGEQLEVEIRDRRRPATSDLLKKARRGSIMNIRVMMQCQLFPISVVCVGKPLSSVCSAQHAVNTYQ